MADTFRCTLITPAQQVFDEEVTYVELPAFDGQMGIEPQRAPMVAKLGDGALRLDFARGESRWYFVAGGFARCGTHADLLTDMP
ncbi:MAG: F0F1 ATP synthase subunit epsilon, partial [Phycisphaerales bacterium]|nr:F0F1 ATP synthase subunit epsilon [Phycisphaerales bacterium]